MSIIRILEPRIANMIAAGEVVDRPASVIKELIENSIDAKSTQIHVEVFGFGMTEIIVTDNGVGMDPQDAQLAFSRHATSKISHETDLSSIKTLGFRGEALAAIASVSKIKLITRQQDQDGFFVIYHGGKQISQGLQKANVGTQISVQELFYNTPARFKFIKSDISEKNAIIELFEKLALANPHVRMKLEMDKKVYKETFGNDDYRQLISQIYGPKTIEGMIHFSLNIAKMSIQGYLIAPQFSKTRKKDISFFINGRYIKNYVLTQAVVEGYKGYIMTQRYPMAMIYIQMDPSLLDVNVHPQKYEVKFVNEHLLAYHIELAVKEHLNQQKTPMHIESRSKQPVFEPLSMQFELPQIEENRDEKTMVLTKQNQPAMMDYIGSFSGTYLLFQDDEGMLMVDQHAAEERIRYEKTVKAFQNQVNTSIRLLFPKTLMLSNQDIQLIEDYRLNLFQLGFQFNEQHQLIKLPIWLEEDRIEMAIESFLSLLLENKTVDLAKYRDELAKSISCKASIKGNQPLSRQEAIYLLNTLFEAENPNHCPHGRPTMVRLTHQDFEKMFKRIPQ